MRDINELVGVIRGISFDGVINDKEIEKLQSWVDNNRSLSYDAYQATLIEKVDQVLEDKIITDDERQMLLEYCDSNLDASDETSAIVFELNGIIEGVICDNEVNESEIYHLKDWMTAKGDIVRNYKPTSKICKMIDDILEDGIVTPTEQEEMLQLLSDHINDVQFETKIDYLCGCVRDRKNIGLDLIDLLDNKVAIKEIHDRAEKELLQTLNSYSVAFVVNPEIVFVSLVLIAMMNYDGSFYIHVQDTYRKAYARYSEQRVEGLIRTIMNRYRKEEDRKCGKSRIINAVLENAIVPRVYLSSFFAFIYDIYKLNFDYDISHDMYDDFRFVFEGLRESMLSDSDDLKVNVTKKTYKLIKTTKRLIVDPEHMDMVIKLGIIVIRLIDKTEWGQEVNLYNPYLIYGYEEWLKTIRKSDKGKARKKLNSRIRSRWEPKFLLDEETVFLVPPVHRIKAQYDYLDICVYVYNDGEELFRCDDDLDIREIIGGYQISTYNIPIDKPLGKLSYRLMANDKVLYDSKELLYREYIVFNMDSGKEIKNNTDYSGNVILCVGESTETPFYKVDNYLLEQREIREGDAILVQGDIFNFSSLTKPGVLGEPYKNYHLKQEGETDEIPLFYSVRALVFECSRVSEKFAIEINEKMYRLEEFEYKVSPRGSYNKYMICLEGVDPGIYDVAVYQLHQGKKEKVLHSSYAVDPDLRAKSEPCGNDEYLLSVESSLLNNHVMKKIKIQEFDIDWLGFEFEGNKYILVIPFELDIYRNEEDTWTSFQTPMWIGDVEYNSVLDVYGSYDQVSILTSEGAILEQVLDLKTEGVITQIPIGFLISYKQSYDYVVLAMMKAGVIRSGIFCYNRCVLDEDKTEILYNHQTRKLEIRPRFYGKGKVYFCIIDDKGRDVYTSKYLTDSYMEGVGGLQSFTNYTIRFFETSTELFLAETRLLKEYNQVFYDRRDFPLKTFRIPEVLFDQEVKGVFERKKHYFRSTYIYFVKMISDGRFIGKLYVKTNYSQFELAGINPVEVEICSDVIDNTVELSITKDGDGLLMDFEHHGILNTMDDKNAVDIYSYSMDMQQEEMI